MQSGPGGQEPFLKSPLLPPTAHDPILQPLRARISRFTWSTKESGKVVGSRPRQYVGSS